jgi:hypothetical protein
MSKDFDWSEDRANIVVKPVEAIAVYKNDDGNIVIRQQDAMGDQDSFVVIPAQHAAKLIAAIRRELKDT